MGTGQPTVMTQRDPTTRRGLRAVSSGGDHYADWQSVYEDNAVWIYRTIYARVGNKPDAEDLTAEVFLAALRPLRLTVTKAEVRAYLRTTARTVLAAHWRETLGREITSIPDTQDIADQLPEADEPISTAPEHARAVLAALPENYRRILELRFLQCCSIKESAARMGTTVANAKVLQHRALRLAAQINDQDAS